MMLAYLGYENVEALTEKCPKDWLIIVKVQNVKKNLISEVDYHHKLSQLKIAQSSNTFFIKILRLSQENVIKID